MSGLPPEQLRFVAPILWVAAFAAASWIVGWHTALSKHVYRAASALALVAGLATAGLAQYARTAELGDAANSFWIVIGAVAAVLGAASLVTARTRLDWQFYEAAG
jgi:uncharacterized membrane protein